MPKKTRQPKAKGTRRTVDLSSHTPAATAVAPALAQGSAKRVYLIRHGESQGQRASRDRRSTDPNLIDCPITHQGEYQATTIPRLLGSERYGRISHVISSPLTRAVQTSLIGFPAKPIVIQYDLFEVGGREKATIPENRPRRLKEVLADTGGDDRVDGITFAPLGPTGFPKSHETLSKQERKERLRLVWPQLWQFCQERDCDEIAIVCHYNIIRAALPDSAVSPQNAIPIECLLHASGRIEVVDVLSDMVEEVCEVISGTQKEEGDEYDDEGYMVFD